MGFLDDYDVDLNEFNESGFDIPDDLYSFTVAKGELKVGTTKDDEARHIVIHFGLENGNGEAFSYNWWLAVPADPSRPTRRESISMSDWKKWCIAAGFPLEQLNSVGPDDVEGLTGTVRLVTGKPGKNGVAYQNPRDWTFDTAEEEAPAPKAPRKAAKPAPEPEEDDEEDAAPAPRSRAKSNPFAK